jgi:hypothetical protein
VDSDYDIVPYQPELKPQVVELQKHLWSPDPGLNRAYFEWKYERNPYVSAPLVYLAVNRGAVVGMRGFLGMRWEAGLPAQTLTGLCAEDLVIAPGHRNRGLIPRIMGAAFEDLVHQGHEYAFSLSAGPVTYVSSLAAGWRAAGSGRPMCAGAWPWHLAAKLSVARSLVRRVQRASHGKVDRVFRSFAGTDPGEVGRCLQKNPGNHLGVSFVFEPPLDAMSELVERIGTDGRIRHVRNRTYFEWRFQNPRSRYGFLIYGSGSLEGYLVLQESASGYSDPTRLNVVDWEATSTLALDRLLEAACRIAGHGKELFVWSATLSREKLDRLAKGRFRLQEEERLGGHTNSILVRSLVTGRPVADWLLAGKSLADLADWDVRMLYSMHW